MRTTPSAPFVLVEIRERLASLADAPVELGVPIGSRRASARGRETNRRSVTR
jgi:hypothetical protein